MAENDRQQDHAAPAEQLACRPTGRCSSLWEWAPSPAPAKLLACQPFLWTRHTDPKMWPYLCRL